MELRNQVDEALVGRLSDLEPVVAVRWRK
jgi:hypothetical protein